MRINIRNVAPCASQVSVQGAQNQQTTAACLSSNMSDDAVSLVDAKIASLEEVILKCEVQYQKVKRQCESSAACAVGDKHPQVLAFFVFCIGIFFACHRDF
jgi:hypothetical protein